MSKLVAAFGLSIALTVGEAQIRIPGTPSLPPVAYDDHPWPMRHANPQRTGQSYYRGPQSGVVAWKYKVAGPVYGLAVSRDGLAITGPTFNEAWWSGEVYVSALSGENLIWHYKVVPYAWGMSQEATGTPAFNPLGGIVVSSTSGQLLRLDRFGNLLWTFQMASNASNDTSPAVLGDGSVRHVQPGFGTVGVSASGQQMFQTAAGGTVSSVGVSTNGEMAVGGTRSNQPHTFIAVWYLNADGSIRWTKTTTYGGGSTAVFGKDGTLFIGLDSLGTYAFWPDGSVRWQSPVGGWLQTPALGKIGQLYIGGTSITALNPNTGATLWSTPINGSAIDGLAIDVMNVIYATTSTGYVVGVNSNGTIKFQTRICDQFISPPSIATNSSIVACGRIGFEYFVFCIK